MVRPPRTQEFLKGRSCVGVRPNTNELGARAGQREPVPFYRARPRSGRALMGHGSRSYRIVRLLRQLLPLPILMALPVPLAAGPLPLRTCSVAPPGVATGEADRARHQPERRRGHAAPRQLLIRPYRTYHTHAPPPLCTRTHASRPAGGDARRHASSRA